MKIQLCTVISMILSLFFPTAARGNIDMTISFDQESFGPGESIPVTVTLKNNTNGTVAIRDFRDTVGNYPNLDFLLVENGENLVLLSKPALDADKNAVATIDLEPGHSHSDTIDLSTWGFEKSLEKYVPEQGQQKLTVIGVYQCVSPQDPEYQHHWELGPVQSEPVTFTFDTGQPAELLQKADPRPFGEIEVTEVGMTRYLSGVVFGVSNTYGSDGYAYGAEVHLRLVQLSAWNTTESKGAVEYLEVGDSLTIGDRSILIKELDLDSPFRLVVDVSAKAP